MKQVRRFIAMLCSNLQVIFEPPRSVFYFPCGLQVLLMYILNISFQNESGVAVEDRVAFACTFLSDAKLNEYLKQLTAKLTEEGDLAGILLTGLSCLYIL
jgi:hypothetical protein